MLNQKDLSLYFSCRFERISEGIWFTKSNCVNDLTETNCIIDALNEVLMEEEYSHELKNFKSWIIN